MRAASLALVTAGLVPWPATAAPAPPAADPLLVAEREFDQAARRVSHPSTPLPMLESCRAYRLPGYGVLFVLPPRALPRAAGPARGPVAAEPRPEVSRALQAIEEGLRGVEPGTVRARIEETLDQMRLSLGEREMAGVEVTIVGGPGGGPEVTVTRTDVLPGGPRAATEPRSPSPVEAIRPTEATPPPAAEGSPTWTRMHETAPPTPRGPAASTPVASGGKSGSSRARPSRLVPAPPWHFWFEAEEVESRSPDEVVADVREALAGVLLRHGARLPGVAPGEFVSAVVDFVHGVGAPVSLRPARTLAVRARRSDLERLARGQIPAAESAGIVEVMEY